MITEFEHKFNIGDTVFLIFYSCGKYRVRKKTGYKIKLIVFNLSIPWSYGNQPKDKIEKSVCYFFDGKNPSVRMTEESSCFATLDDAEAECINRNNRGY